MKTERYVPGGVEAKASGCISRIFNALKEKFPGSRAGIIIAQSHPFSPTESRIIISEGHTTELCYMASLSKPAFMVTGLSLAEKLKISLEEPVITLTQEEIDVTNKELRSHKLPELPTQDEQGKIPLLSFKDITSLLLGASANPPLEALKRWITENNPDHITGADYAQEKTEQLLKDVLKKDNVTWTFRGSKKADENGTWNCATLEEIFYFFQLIANGDKRLGLSQEAISIMQGGMRISADENIELNTRLRRNAKTKVKDVFGKSGYWPYTEKEDIVVLPDMYGLGPEGFKWLMHIGSVERVIRKGGRIYDIGYYVAIPHNKPQKRFGEIKQAATNIISKGLAKLVAT